MLTNVRSESTQIAPWNLIVGPEYAQNGHNLALFSHKTGVGKAANWLFCPGQMVPEGLGAPGRPITQIVHPSARCTRFGVARQRSLGPASLEACGVRSRNTVSTISARQCKETAQHRWPERMSKVLDVGCAGGGEHGVGKRDHFPYRKCKRERSGMPCASAGEAGGRYYVCVCRRGRRADVWALQG